MINLHVSAFRLFWTTVIVLLASLTIMTFAPFSKEWHMCLSSWEFASKIRSNLRKSNNNEQDHEIPISCNLIQLRQRYEIHHESRKYCIITRLELLNESRKHCLNQ